MSTEMQEPEVILIVDDVPQNLQVLGSMLEQAGYDTAFATNGEEAIAMVANSEPALILLDVMMPVLDGFETCRRLKSSPGARDIPVIFLTALNDVESVVAGFNAGGVDFVSKPFNERELRARVSAHLSLRRTQRALVAANAARERFISIIGHDLRGPLGTLAASLEMLSSVAMEPAEKEEWTANMAKSARRIYNLTEDLLSWARLQRDEMRPEPTQIPLRSVADETMKVLGEQAKSKRIQLILDVDETLTANADLAMITTIIRNLLSNALKFTPPGGTVTVQGQREGAGCRIEVIDTGTGMSAAQLDSLFEIGRMTSRPGTAGERGSGLGLILCREFARKNGGDLALASEEGKGTTVTIKLPGDH